MAQTVSAGAPHAGDTNCKSYRGLSTAEMQSGGSTIRKMGPEYTYDADGQYPQLLYDRAVSSSDIDGDSIPNHVESICGSDPLSALSRPTDAECVALALDTDGDRRYNFHDTDDDGDDVPDVTDNCPLVANTDQKNTDVDTGDTLGDECDLDDDGDGWSDRDEMDCGTRPLDIDDMPSDTDSDGICDTTDNCPLVANTDQMNTDGDPFGNVCDSDVDGDGWSDSDEMDCGGTNPLDATSVPSDTDRDGICNTADNCPFMANPDQMDNDGDTLGDACEDSDGDTIFDDVDVDDDNDGLIEIYTLADLHNMRDNLAGTSWKGSTLGSKSNRPNCAGRTSTNLCGYELMATLDFNPGCTTVVDETLLYAGDDYCEPVSGMPYDNGGEGWQPIGNDSASFSAIFDGNRDSGYSIQNLYINNSTLNRVGLFGRTSGAIIRSVALTQVNVGTTGSVTGASIGGLVGYSVGSSITNSYTTGSVSGVVGTDSNVGGLVGYSVGSSITNSYATGRVTGGSRVGGLVGSSSSSITNSYATGSVSGSVSGSGVGGLVGWSSSGSITNSYATGRVTGGSRVGGLVGSSSSIITNSYATGSVSGSVSGSGVGGLVGSSSGSITNSYATGDVTSSGNSVGGLGGWEFVVVLVLRIAMPLAV